VIVSITVAVDTDSGVIGSADQHLFEEWRRDSRHVVGLKPVYVLINSMPLGCPFSYSLTMNSATTHTEGDRNSDGDDRIHVITADDGAGAATNGVGAGVDAAAAVEATGSVEDAIQKHPSGNAWGHGALPSLSANTP
jgi:hypothetical protein